MKNQALHAAFVSGVILLIAVPFAACQQKDAAQTASQLLKSAAGVGAPYGARDPLHCASTKAPASGAPSAEQVKAYFISAFEREKSSGRLGELYLTADVKVEIGKGRPFESGDGAGDIDTHERVYPIRGSYTYYRCYPLSSAHPAGKSSKKILQPNAEGFCYKTTFGDWRCSMADFHTGKTLDGYFPAPK